MAKLKNINTNVGETVLDRNTKAEVYRTPAYSYLPLLDYKPEWFSGIGFDPSAGDGRMIAEVIRRGNAGPHFANDIREEEEALMRESLGDNAHISIGDYLAMENPPEVDFSITNPPFTLSVEFVKKAQQHVRGPICILQSVAWQGTHKRSQWLKESGLAYVLNLSKRPRWEVDVGIAHSNIWDFAWFVFLPNHNELPRMDWLFV
jgi:hypothetical protein